MCFNPMTVGGRSGTHTVARPFDCVGGTRHAICRSCDQRMFQGHDDRCPICRAERSGMSIATSGSRAPGIPVHERRDDGGFALQQFFVPIDESQPAYVSVITRPGGDQIFHSLEEMLDGIVAGGPGGISRARIMSSAGARGHRTTAVATSDLSDGLRQILAAINAQQAGAANAESMAATVAAAVSAIHSDPQINAALEGLTNPQSVSLGTFLDRVRGTSQAQTRRHASRDSFARRRGAASQ